MPIDSHLGPDLHLDLETRTSVSRLEAHEAWTKAYADLEAALARRTGHGTLFVVCGPQGSGKTTWIKKCAAGAEPSVVYFDAALPSRQHRSKAIALAKAARCRAVAVWLAVPLPVALARNAGRQGAARIAEATIRHVFEQLEPPTVGEGFDEVIVVSMADSEA